MSLFGLTVLVAACGGPSLGGWYPTEPGSSYGFEFRDGAVYSHVGGEIMRGTYSVDGAQLRVCFGPFCNDLEIDGDCLVDRDAPGRYCREG